MLFLISGRFLTEDETQLLLKTFMVNLFISNPSIRRSTATCLNSICQNSAKPDFFLPWLLASTLDVILPLEQHKDTPSHVTLGVLMCAKTLMPGLNKVKGAEEGCELLDRLLQIYELCLHLITNHDGSIVTMSLETLLALLRHSNMQLRIQLTSHTGISKSRIYSNVGANSNAVQFDVTG